MPIPIDLGYWLWFWLWHWHWHKHWCDHCLRNSKSFCVWNTRLALVVLTLQTWHAATEASQKTKTRSCTHYPHYTHTTTVLFQTPIPPTNANATTKSTTTKSTTTTTTTTTTSQQQKQRKILHFHNCSQNEVHAKATTPHALPSDDAPLFLPLAPPIALANEIEFASAVSWPWTSIHTPANADADESWDRLALPTGTCHVGYNTSKQLCSWAFEHLHIEHLHIEHLHIWAFAHLSICTFEHLPIWASACGFVLCTRFVHSYVRPPNTTQLLSSFLLLFVVAAATAVQVVGSVCQSLLLLYPTQPYPTLSVTRPALVGSLS